MIKEVATLLILVLAVVESLHTQIPSDNQGYVTGNQYELSDLEPQASGQYGYGNRGLGYNNGYGYSNGNGYNNRHGYNNGYNRGYENYGRNLGYENYGRNFDGGRHGGRW